MIELLEMAKEHIDKSWCQYATGRSSSGARVESDELGKAEGVDIIGALLKAERKGNFLAVDRLDAHEALLNASKERYDGPYSLVYFNNHVLRTHEEVIDFFQEVIDDNG